MRKPRDEMLLCVQCVTAPRFSDWIKAAGQLGQCDFDVEHGSQGHVVSVELFAIHVDEFFREHYQPGSEEPYVTEASDNVSYQQRGSSLLEILSEELASDDDPVVEAIIENLPDVSHRDVLQGAEPFYDDTASYESIADVERWERADQEEYWYENRFTFQWEDFCEKVQYGHRFFGTKEPLDKLFGKPSEYEGAKLNPIYMLKTAQRVFRARVLNGSFTEDVLNLNPAGELGAPPRESARAGRMNVEYIPAFYGAFSEQTAVAEMRPGIGDEVAIGEFVLRREIKVFDFTVFSRSPHEDWRDVYAHTRYDFIKQMEEEISRRVLPYEKQRRYISTQIVAEYLRKYFGCEAVIYRCSVVTGHALESRNIVFLPRGESFIEGNRAILKHHDFVVKEVQDVTYQLMKRPF